MKKYEEPKMKLHELMAKTAMLAGSPGPGDGVANTKGGASDDEHVEDFKTTYTSSQIW